MMTSHSPPPGIVLLTFFSLLIFPLSRALSPSSFGTDPSISFLLKLSSAPLSSPGSLARGLHAGHKSFEAARSSLRRLLQTSDLASSGATSAIGIGQAGFRSEKVALKRLTPIFFLFPPSALISHLFSFPLPASPCAPRLNHKGFGTARRPAAAATRTWCRYATPKAHTSVGPRSSRGAEADPFLMGELDSVFQILLNSSSDMSYVYKLEGLFRR